MADYRRADGTETTAEDPQRLLWYGAGQCGYWTDDWSKLNTDQQIPICPDCGAPGMQTEAEKWNKGAEQYQANGNPGYVNFLNDEKEKCGRSEKIGFTERFKRWLVNHPNGKSGPSPRSDGS